MKIYIEVGKKSENPGPGKLQATNHTMSKDSGLKSFAPVCLYCKNNLYMLCNMYLYNKHVLAYGKYNWHSEPNRAESSIASNKSEIIREELKPFVSEGFVSFDSI